MSDEGIRVPVTREMLTDLVAGKEVGFVKSGQRIVLSPSFENAVCDVELQEVQDGDEADSLG